MPRPSSAQGIGSVFWPRSAAAVNALQRVAVEETRLGIPILVGLDVIHGQRTIAPVPLAQAASFDPPLVRDLARTRRGGGALGRCHLDVLADGRCLARPALGPRRRGLRRGRASERGHGRGDGARLPGRRSRRARRDRGDREALRRLRTARGRPRLQHRRRLGASPPQRLPRALPRGRRAGVASVMASFNTVAGMPMHANRRLLTDVLKNEWGFGGIVVGDAEGVRNLLPHGIAENLEDAVRLSYSAGLDIEMGGAPAALDARRARSASTPRASTTPSRACLALKEALGLFDSPYRRRRRDHRAVRRRARTRALGGGPFGRAPAQRRHAAAPRPARVLLTGPYAESTRSPRRLDAVVRRARREHRRRAARASPRRRGPRGTGRRRSSTATTRASRTRSPPRADATS